MAMQRTKALGLLHKQLRKDSAMSRQGIPDYLVTMRKPGMNEKPIAGLLDYYSGDITNTQFHVLIANEYQLKKREDPKFNMPFEEFYSVNIWQRYASPVWMDIDPSDTLQRSTAREDKDERHICPLQLGVIRRGIQLWSMPGDIVASPFGGIGSEPYVAIEMGRKAIAAELKPIYWELGVRNCRIAEQLPKPLISDEDMEAAA
jgi:DNA modification methylase